jgi:hypothetical protein
LTAVELVRTGPGLKRRSGFACYVKKYIVKFMINKNDSKIRTKK